MSQHAHRSCRSPDAFQARSVPGSLASQMPAAPFLPVCRSRGCRYSSNYRQGRHLRQFPRRPRLSHRMAADCGYLGQLSDILPQGQSQGMGPVGFFIWFASGMKAVQARAAILSYSFFWLSVRVGSIVHHHLLQPGRQGLSSGIPPAADPWSATCPWPLPASCPWPLHRGGRH